MKLLLAIYASLFVLFSLFTYLYIDPNFIYLKILFTGFAFDKRLIVTLFYILSITAFFVIYFLILNNNSTNLKNLKWFFCIPLFGILAYPAALSFDLFNYLATAKVTFAYFENPYIIMPIEFQGDPMLLFTHAANKIALYGPLWIGITSLPFYLSAGNYLISVVLFKLLVGIFYFGIVYLIWKMTKSIYSVLFFAASPLVLIETFISGHNDVVMMALALLSVYCLKKNKLFPALVFLFLSILIKYATLFLIPLFIYYLYKRIIKEEIDWDKFYLWGFILMLIIFFLSPLREEIYPWYAIWPLTFLSLAANKWKTLSSIFIFFTFCLMLRYVPFMLIGTYFGPTPSIKLIITFVLPSSFAVILLVKNKLSMRK